MTRVVSVSRENLMLNHHLWVSGEMTGNDSAENSTFKEFRSINMEIVLKLKEAPF